MPSARRWTWKLKFRLHLWCAYCPVRDNYVWRACVCLLCDTHRSFVKLRFMFARKSRTRAYVNINSWQACLSLLCWIVLPAKAFFLKQNVGRYSGSQLFVIAGHKRRERERKREKERERKREREREREKERERCVFFWKGTHDFATVHCYLICIQIVIFLQLSICRRSLYAYFTPHTLV